MPLQDEKIYRHERTPLELIGGGVIPFPPPFTPPNNGGGIGINPPIPQLPYDKPPSPIYRVERYGCQECLITYFEGKEVNRSCYRIEGCDPPTRSNDDNFPSFPNTNSDEDPIIEEPNFELPIAGDCGYRIYTRVIGSTDYQRSQCIGNQNYSQSYPNEPWYYFEVPPGAKAITINFPYSAPSGGKSNFSMWAVAYPSGYIEQIGFTDRGRYYNAGFSVSFELCDFDPEDAPVKRKVDGGSIINTWYVDKPECFLDPTPPPIPTPPGNPPMNCCDCLTISYIVSVNRLTLFNQIKQELKNTENYLLENLKIDYSIIANMLNQQSLAISEVTLDIVNQYKNTNSESFRVTMDAIVNLQKTLLDINEIQTTLMYENTFYITDYVQSIIENIQIDTSDLVLYLNDLIVEVNKYAIKYVTDYIRDVSEIEMNWLNDTFINTIETIYGDTDYLVSVSTQTIINSLTSEIDYLYGELSIDIYGYIIPSLNIIRDDIVSYIQYYHLLHLDSEISLFRNLQAYIKFLFDSLDLGNNQNLIDIINRLRDDIVARFNTLDLDCGEQINRSVNNLQQNILNEFNNLQTNVVNNIQNISVKCPEINVDPIITILNNLTEITNEIKDSLKVEIVGNATCEAITDNKNINWSGLGIVGLNKQLDAIIEYLKCVNTFNTVIIKGEIETRCKEEEKRYPYEGKGLTGIASKLEATAKVHQEVLTRLCEMEDKEPQCVSMLPGEIFLERGITKQLIISFGLEYPTQKGTLTHIHIPEPIDNLSWDNFENWFRPMGNVLGRVQFKGMKQPVGGYALTEADALSLCEKIKSLSKLESEDHNGQAGRITKGGRVKQPNFTNRTYRPVRAVVTEIGADGNPTVLKCFTPPKN